MDFNSKEEVDRQIKHVDDRIKRYDELIAGYDLLIYKCKVVVITAFVLMALLAGGSVFVWLFLT